MATRNRLAVLISGSGSNLQAILDACANRNLPAEIVLVVSNHAGAYGVERARKAGVPVVVLPGRKDQERRAYDARLAEVVAEARPDWVVLAGWMRILTSEFLNPFAGKVINLHPALPGAFPGTHAIQRAFESFQRGEIQSTGVMVHLVPDEGVDSGPTLAVETVAILPSDTPSSLEERIHQVEHRLLVATLHNVLTGDLLNCV